MDYQSKHKDSIGQPALKVIRSQYPQKILIGSLALILNGEMIQMIYKSIVVECSTGAEELAKTIEKKAEEMMNRGYKLVTMSTVGTDKAILVFKI